MSAACGVLSTRFKMPFTPIHHLAVVPSAASRLAVVVFKPTSNLLYTVQERQFQSATRPAAHWAMALGLAGFVLSVVRRVVMRESSLRQTTPAIFFTFPTLLRTPGPSAGPLSALKLARELGRLFLNYAGPLGARRPCAAGPWAQMGKRVVGRPCVLPSGSHKRGAVARPERGQRPAPRLPIVCAVPRLPALAPTIAGHCRRRLSLAASCVAVV